MTLSECQECFGIGAPCGNLGDNNHCENCHGTGKVDLNEQSIEQLICVLLRADTDLVHWINFAKRQMEELTGWDKLPCGPTRNGIEESEAVRFRIAQAIRTYRQVASSQ